ncbi:MAG: hypothetical protein ABGY08_12680 [Gammaproteobacteria bacterium]
MSNGFKFVYRDLEKLLVHMKETAPVVPLKDAPKMENGYIILRHDVDMDIYPAYLVSKIEKKLAIRSTFFIMLTSPYYNPCSSENRDMIRKMVEDGHEIGLHFDPTIYLGASIKELVVKAKFESSILESITGKKVLSVSLHNPGEHGNYVHLDGFINAYHSDYFSKEKYISDSYIEKSFENKDPYEFVSRARKTIVQILLHPCHFTNDEENFEKKCEAYINRKRSQMSIDFRLLLGK